MSNSLSEINGLLESSDLDERHDLRAVLSSALKSRAVVERPDRTRAQAFWPAEHFKLDQSSVFREANEEEKRKILESCCCDVLEEAYWIEKCGMHFASRMSLLSRSTQERMLYSLFAADEAIHFNWISSYVSTDKISEATCSPFIKLLDEILRNEDKLTLTCIVQVILEGWGISHYHSLLSHSTDSGLSKILEQIIKDEARHHASGVILFNEQKLSSNQIRRLVDVINNLLFMVRVGPQSVVSRMEQVKGHFSKTQKTKIFEQLACESESTRKLEILRALIRSAACAEAVLDELDRNGAFKPFSAFECATLSDG